MSSRRDFLKNIGVATASLTLASCNVINEQPERREGDSTKRWGMLIDLRQCIGCQSCTVSCNIENATPIGNFRTTVDQYEFTSEDGSPNRVMLPRLCNHCDAPPCVPVCPVQATFQRKDGIVVVDNKRCVACAYCVQACPYNARFINKETHTADKCTFCAHRLEDGLLPACVESCVGGARIMGDLNDPKSYISQMIEKHKGELRVLREESKTKPRIYYIGMSKEFEDRIKGQVSIY